MIYSYYCIKMVSIILFAWEQYRTEVRKLKSILLELFQGEIAPLDRYKVILKEYKEQWENTMKSENSFVKKLDEPLREEFEKLMDDHFDLIPLEMSDVFAEGFRISARMMVESLWGKDSNEPEGLL